MNKMDRTRRIFPAITTIIIIIALGIYLLKNRDAFISLVNINPLYLFIIAVTHLLFILVMAFLNIILLQKLDPNIGASEIIHLQFVNNFLNKIILNGGIAFRAGHLKHRYNLSYSKFLASFAGLVVVNLAAQSLIGLSGMYFVYLRTGHYNLVVTLGFISIILGTLFIMIIRPKTANHRSRFLREINKLVEGWKIVVRNPRDVIIFVIISFVAVFIQALNTFIVFVGINSPIGFPESLILSSLAGFVSYINITPDGLGAREGVYLYTNSIMSISEPMLVLGSLVQRALTFIISALVGGFSYLILIRKPKAGNDKEDPH